VRTISVHYAAIARHLKNEGIDLLGAHADQLTPDFRAMLENGEKFSSMFKQTALL